MKPQQATFQITDRWRLSEDGDVQWILEKLSGKTWRAKAWCGTKDGLIGVALPHNRIAAPNTVLDALSHLPESYEPGALGRLAGDMLDRAA